MTAKKKYPGFLVYFDQMDGVVAELNDRELGAIFRATYLYARDGELPAFQNQGLRISWDYMQKMVDRDKESYEEKCRKNSYNAACSAAKHKGLEKPDEAEFMANYTAGSNPKTVRKNHPNFPFEDVDISDVFL